MSHRTQITLTDNQYDRLREESSRTGLSLAALVRQAIESSYGAPSSDDTLLALETSFGSWRDREFDGEEYAAGLRRGLGYRLIRR